MKKILFIALFAVALAALVSSVMLGIVIAAFVFTERSEETSRTDARLREFLGVSTIASVYTFPKDAKYYYLTSLGFEDGKLTEDKGFASYGQISAPSIDFEIIWSPEMPKMIVHMPSRRSGVHGRLRSFNIVHHDFWLKLDGGAYALDKTLRKDYFGTLPQDQKFADYTILGFATSQLKQNGEMSSSTSSFFPKQLEEKKYVGAVVVKTFRTEEEFKKGLEAIGESWDN